jgi:hypothetical protein
MVFVLGRAGILEGIKDKTRSPISFTRRGNILQVLEIFLEMLGHHTDSRAQKRHITIRSNN